MNVCFHCFHKIKVIVTFNTSMLTSGLKRKTKVELVAFKWPSNQWVMSQWLHPFLLLYTVSQRRETYTIYVVFFYIFCAALVQEYLSHLPLKLKKMGQENKNFYWKLAHKNISQPLRAWTTLAKRVFFSHSNKFSWHEIIFTPVNWSHCIHQPCTDGTDQPYCNCGSVTGKKKYATLWV